MTKYTIKDFIKGDRVYHLSNTKLIMVAVEIHNEMNEVSCRWIDKNEQVHCTEFASEELGKVSDIEPKITSVTSLP